MKKLFLVSSALVILWSQGAIADKGALECHVMGWTYEVGHNGTPKNLHTAYKYYEKADKKGHPIGEESMKRVVSQMTPEQQEMYNPNRSIPELPPEVLVSIIAQSGAAVPCLLVSKQFNDISQDKAISEDDTLWSPFAQRYSVDKKEGIPLKRLVQVDYYMKKALHARAEEWDDLKNRRATQAQTNNLLWKSFLNQATQVSDGSAFWFSIPNDDYWKLLRCAIGCKNVIEVQIKKGNKEALRRKWQGLFHGWYGYKDDSTARLDFRKEMKASGNLDVFPLKINNTNNNAIGSKRINHDIFRHSYMQALKDPTQKLSKLQGYLNLLLAG